MEHTTPTRNEIVTENPPPTVDDGPTISFEVRPHCTKCDRLATVFDRDQTPYCARHATIFMYGSRTPT